jgi:hypothetical protein
VRITPFLPFSVLCLLVAAAPGRATTYLVDRTDDPPSASACQDATPNDCSLRGAILAANANPGADTIMLPANTYTLTITGRGEDVAATGDLDITGDVTIVGAGAPTTIIDGGGIDRIFDVWAHLTASGLTIRNGNPGTGLPGGGGIYSAMGTTAATVNLTDVTVSGNSASHGGGIDNDVGSTLNLTNVTVSGNTGSLSGGGIENMGTATLTNVTISGNTAGTGNGIENQGVLTLLNVTSSGTLDGAADSIRNTIVAGSCTGGGCMGGACTTEDHDLDTGTGCGFADASDLSSTNPDLGPLQDNGGPTFTQALAGGSPAIDAAGGCPPPGTDQRGVIRPVDGNGDSVAVCDLGAFEFEPGAATTTTTTPGGSSTTTTTLQCPVAQTFDSISCRLTALGATVQAQVQAGTVRDRLVALLGKAVSKVQQGETALGQGSKKQAKTALAKAVGPLRKFGARLRSKAGKKAILADLRASLQASATQLRTDVLALRRSL